MSSPLKNGKVVAISQTEIQDKLLTLVEKQRNKNIFSKNFQQGSAPNLPCLNEDLKIENAIDKSRKKHKIKTMNLNKKFKAKYNLWKDVATYIDTENLFSSINRINESPRKKMPSDAMNFHLSKLSSGKQFSTSDQKLLKNQQLNDKLAHFNKIHHERKTSIFKEEFQKKFRPVHDSIENIIKELEGLPKSLKDDQENYFEFVEKLLNWIKTREKIKSDNHFDQQYDPSIDPKMTELKKALLSIASNNVKKNLMPKEEYSNLFSIQSKFILKQLKKLSKNIFALKSETKNLPSISNVNFTNPITTQTSLNGHDYFNKRHASNPSIFKKHNISSTSVDCYNKLKDSPYLTDIKSYQSFDNDSKKKLINLIEKIESVEPSKDQISTIKFPSLDRDNKSKPLESLKIKKRRSQGKIPIIYLNKKNKKNAHVDLNKKLIQLICSELNSMISINIGSPIKQSTQINLI